MGFNKVNGIWTRVRGGRPQDEEEELGEEEVPAEEEAPAVDPAFPADADTEFVVPEDIHAPTVSPVRRPARQRIDFSAEAASSVPPSQSDFVRLHPDDIAAIARELAQHVHVSADQSTTPASSSSSLVPHHSFLAQMMSDILQEVRTVSSDVHRLTGRQFDLEQRVFAVERSLASLSEKLSASFAGIPSGSETPSSIADLTAEAGRLRGLLQTSSVALGILSSEMDRKFGCVDLSFYSLRKEIESLGSRLDRLISLFPCPDPVSARPSAPTSVSPINLPSYRPSQAPFGPPSRTRATSAKRKATSSSQPMTIMDSSDSDES